MTNFLKKKALQNAIAVLEGMGASYRIKLDEEEFCNFVEAPKKKKRQNNFRAIYRDKIKNLKVGSAVEVAVPTTDAAQAKVDIYRLQSSIAAFAVNHWGKQSAMTHIDSKRRVVEVMRIA